MKIATIMHSHKASVFQQLMLRCLAIITLTLSVWSISWGQTQPHPYDVRGVREVTLSQPKAVVLPDQSQALEALKKEHPGKLKAKWSGLTNAPSRLLRQDGKPLTKAKSGDHEQIARGYINRMAKLLNLSKEDRKELRTSRKFVGKTTGITHLTLQQQANGIDVFGADLRINVAEDGRIINVSGEAIPNLRTSINTSVPTVSAEDAMANSVAATGIRDIKEHKNLGLVYFPMSRGDVRLSHKLTYLDADSPNQYMVIVDAVSGQLLWRNNLTHYNHIPTHGAVYDNDSPIPYTPNESTPGSAIPRVDSEFNGGDFFPHDDLHYDWWAGNARTTTTSNNVDAYADRDGDNSADASSRPTAVGGDEDFTNPVDLTQEPDMYQAAAVVNLFYWNNRIHDFFYRLGFDEASGNFQSDNLGLGGSGGDAVRAEAQDNADGDPRSLCNANMNTPGDGSPPRMQMFLCDRSNPERDGDFDAMVIGHEYTHGVHSRLVATSGNQRANEGWSDYFGLSIIAEPGDPYDGSYGVGNYLFNNSGIRSDPYSTDLSVYNRRYADIFDSGSCATKICSSDSTESCNDDVDCSNVGDTCDAVACDFQEDCDMPPNDIDLGACRLSPHRTGEVWANALWIARMNIIAKTSFATGARTMNQVVIDGMKLSPSDPTFLDGRDAILMADEVTNGGVNVCLIWDAFAKMGMGVSALTSGIDDINPLQAFDVPSACAPNIQVSADTHIGEICLADDSTTNELQVSNTGTGELIVSTVERVSGSTDITVEGIPVTPVILSAGSSINFGVTCAPTTEGDKTATIRVSSNDADSPQTDVIFTCGVGEAEIVTTFDNGFGEVCLDDTKTQELRIQNSGSCPLTVSSISSSNGEFDLAEVMNFPLSIAAGVEVTVPIEFAPAVNFGNENAVLSIVHDASNAASPKQVSADGTSPPGDIQVAIADSGNFGSVCKTDEKDLNLTLFNQGACDLSISSIDLVPPGGSFELPQGVTFPLVLSHDADFNLPVRYSPEFCSDSPEAATVVIASDDPDEQIVNVDIAGVAPCPNLVIDPSGLTAAFAFPSTVVDSTGTLGCSSERSVALRNNSVCPLTISDISAMGVSNVLDFSVVTPTQFPLLLPGGEETLLVNVGFTPQADDLPLEPSELFGMLTVISDDPDAGGAAELCGEPVAQSGVRILVSDITTGTPVLIPEVDSMVLQSKGKKLPGPINLRFTDVPLKNKSICGNSISYHIDQETLPAVGTAGSNPKSSYLAKASEGNLSAQETFSLDQCEFRDFQLQLKSSSTQPPGACLLLPKGAACSNAGECCSGKCNGPNGGKSCK